MEPGAHRGQRYVDDRDVEDDHELGQADDDRSAFVERSRFSGLSGVGGVHDWIWCDNPYPGTREGFILVVELPPSSKNGNGAASVRSANGDRPRGTNGERRREELADFLRTKRQPPARGRRAARTAAGGGHPGCAARRLRCWPGSGTTWYTWLEQGRDVRASLDVLEAVARALQLTPAERAHVILLGRGEQAPPCKPPAEEVSPTLRRLVENTGPGPVYLLGRRWDYLAWNTVVRARIRLGARSRAAVAQPRVGVVHGPGPTQTVRERLGEQRPPARGEVPR